MNGTYETGSQSERISSSGNPLHGVITITGALLAKGTLYDANGNLIGYERFKTSSTRRSLTEPRSLTSARDS